MIKIVLQINGFNSFLALKGIRYDDKKEFFESLELTVKDFCSTDEDSPERSELVDELASQFQSVENFKLRPGHRNYIMNLMLEIEKTEVSDFFGLSGHETVFQDAPVRHASPNKSQFSLVPVTSPGSSQKSTRRSSEKQFVLSQPDHGYSRDDQLLEQQDQQYVIEEEYLTDDTMDSLGIMKLEFDQNNSRNSTLKRKSTSTMTPTSAKKRPDHMYNDEFMAKTINPRRRRVTLNKTYPATDEGTRERFTDLIQQVRFPSIAWVLSNFHSFRVWNVFCLDKHWKKSHMWRFQ